MHLFNLVSDLDLMAPRKKQKLSKDDILKKKREAEKARLARIKSNPIN